MMKKFQPKAIRTRTNYSLVRSDFLNSRLIFQYILLFFHRVIKARPVGKHPRMWKPSVPVNEISLGIWTKQGRHEQRHTS